MNLTFTTAKGNTTTTLSLTPSAPQAGQPVTLTATINNNGNGKLTYNFTGNVTFYDNGQLIATAPVATNHGHHQQDTFGQRAAQHRGQVHRRRELERQHVGASGGSAHFCFLRPSHLLRMPQRLLLASIWCLRQRSLRLPRTRSVLRAASTFYDTFNGSVVQLGTPTPVTPNGPNQSIALFSTTGCSPVAHSVYAIYNGDANFSSATTSTLALTLSDFNITGVPQTLTLKGGPDRQGRNVAGHGRWLQRDRIIWLLSAVQSETTCSFSPATLTGGGSTTLQITTTAATTSSKWRGSIFHRVCLADRY